MSPAVITCFSGGIYAGPWGEGFLADFVCVVNEILTEPQEDAARSAGGAPPLGAWFERVVLTLLQPPAGELSWSKLSGERKPAGGQAGWQPSDGGGGDGLPPAPPVARNSSTERMDAD